MSTGGVTTKAWAENGARYRLIAAADVNEFITAACRTVLRDTLSDEGAARTVNLDNFFVKVSYNI